MNKMTIEKFERFSEKLIEMPINTAVLLKGVIKIVFDKVNRNRRDAFVRVLPKQEALLQALMEQTFSEMYAGDRSSSRSGVKALARP